MTDPEIVAGLKQLRDATTSLNGYDNLALLPREVNVIDAAISRLSATCWQPIETAPDDDTVILRPHRIWGAMDVRRNVNPKNTSVLAAGIDWKWLNGDYTTAWTEEAFLPFWMPLPAMPTEEP